MPQIIEDDAVRLAIISKLGWIRKQQKDFENQPRQSIRELITGESHFFLGKRYLLNVEPSNGFPRIELKNKRIMTLWAEPGTDPEKRKLL